MVECKSFESGHEGGFPLMLNLWQDCAMCSKSSRSATVRTKITSINGLRTADPSNITLLEVLRNLQSRNCFKRRMKPSSGSRSEDEMRSSAVASFGTYLEHIQILQVLMII